MNDFRLGSGRPTGLGFPHLGPALESLAPHKGVECRLLHLSEQVRVGALLGHLLGNAGIAGAGDEGPGISRDGGCEPAPAAKPQKNGTTIRALSARDMSTSAPSSKKIVDHCAKRCQGVCYLKMKSEPFGVQIRLYDV